MTTKKLTTLAATAFAAITLASPAIADTVSFERSAFQQDGFNGGEFIATFENGGSYRTFCLEFDQPLIVGTNVDYQYTLDTDGTDSGDAVDPVSSAAASIFVAWLDGTIENTTENSTAVQNAIWAIEGEIEESTLGATAQAIYDDAVANFSTTDNAVTDNPMFSNIRVLNPYQVINGENYYFQSQIILIPLPTTGGLALAGLAAIGMRRRR
jgi:hypothetical protein